MGEGGPGPAQSDLKLASPPVSLLRPPSTARYAIRPSLLLRSDRSSASTVLSLRAGGLTADKAEAPGEGGGQALREGGVQLTAPTNQQSEGVSPHGPP